jgi:hypothetical protein
MAEEQPNSSESLEVSQDAINAVTLETAEAPPRTRRWSLILVTLFILILAVGGLFLWMYLSQKDFKQARGRSLRFFKILKRGQYNLAYTLMDKSYHEKTTQKQFERRLKESALVFEDLVFSKFRVYKKFWESGSGKARLTGKLQYSDGSEGQFHLKFRRRDQNGGREVFITGFRVMAKQHIEHEYRDAFQTLQEFLKTLPKDDLDNFSSFLYRDTRAKWGRVKLIQVHTKLRDQDFVSHDFKEENFRVEVAVQLKFKGSSMTRGGKTARSTVTLFYEEGNWYVLGFQFQLEVAKE